MRVRLRLRAGTWLPELFGYWFSPASTAVLDVSCWYMRVLRAIMHTSYGLKHFGG
jgi:hypothetical protein